MSLKDRLKEARKNNGKTQKEMSDLLGIKPSTYSGYETGYSEPNMSILANIIDILNCDANYLLQDEINKEEIYKKDSVELSNQEKALINKYRQLNEQQQYEVMGYIDGKLHHNETAKESTPIYKIYNNTHSKVAEQDYTPEYVEARKIAYGAVEDEKYFVDKKAYDKVEEERQKELNNRNSDEEEVIQNLMRATGKSKAECYEIMKQILGID